MAIGVNVRIKGLDELSRNIARLSRAMKDEALREALKAAAKPVLKHAVDKVAVDRGGSAGLAGHRRAHREEWRGLHPGARQAGSEGWISRQPHRVWHL